MTEEIKDIKKYIINKKHVKFRFNAEETEKSSIRKSSEICGIDGNAAEPQEGAPVFAAGSGKAGVHTRDEPCIYANNDYKREYR